MSNISVCILTGGRSERMGTDKACLLYNEKQTYIEHLCEEMSFFEERYISVNSSKSYGIQGFVEVKDELDNIGPMGGLYSVLKKNLSDAVLILAVDMPKYTSGEAKKIIASYKGEDVLLARLPNKKGEPLASIYSVKALSIIEKCIENKDYRMLSIYENALSKGEFFTENEVCYVNHNRPTDIVNNIQG